MNIDEVLDKLGAAVGAIDGLRVTDYAADSIKPPAAVIPPPASIDYDAAKSDGLHTVTFEVFVLIQTTDARVVRKLLTAYQSTTGAKSIKAAIEADPTLDGTVDTTQVTSCDVREVAVAGLEYLAAIFTVEAYGP